VPKRYNKEMERRSFLKVVSAGITLAACGCANHWPRLLSRTVNSENPDPPREVSDFAEVNANRTNNTAPVADTHSHSKVTNFDQDFPDDIFCEKHRLEMIQALLQKFRAVQRRVGDGNFNLLGMDEFFGQAALTSRGPLSREEKMLLEELFFYDAKKYGFYGEKNFHRFTDSIRKEDVRKIAGTGHFLRKGDSEETYARLRRDVGDSIILTSGVRSLAKQFHLFLEKTAVSNGNLSKASRSLAPPGYSFHGHQDFDVGKVGYGLSNFTDDFARTEEYKRLEALGYVEIRYTAANDLGVRFEPWHIKV
jgi:zinc D-Ala-D-Ala carboxypeptidase